MKVKELMEELSKINPEREIIMSKDSEGNSFSPLDEFSENEYKAETSCYGEIGISKTELTDELRKQGYGDEDIIKDGVPAIVLWPTN